MSEPGLAAELLYEIEMDVETRDLGLTPAGRRRIVVVTGGTFTGPGLRGEVLAGGGDWLLERPDGSRALDVRITMQTADGGLIYAAYLGRFHAEPAVMKTIFAGEAVDAGDYYFRVAPLFETAAEKYSWLNTVLAVGYGRRTPTQVAYSVYRLL